MTPAALGLLVLARPITELVYLWKGGEFNAHSAVVTVRALMFYAPGLLVLDLARLNREIQQLRNLNKQLGEDYGQAVLARAQDEVDVVHLAAAAVPVDRPMGRLIVPKSLTAGLLGAFLGLLVAIVRESRSSARSGS